MDRNEQIGPSATRNTSSGQADAHGRVVFESDRPAISEKQDEKVRCQLVPNSAHASDEDHNGTKAQRRGTLDQVHKPREIREERSEIVERMLRPQEQVSEQSQASTSSTLLGTSPQSSSSTDRSHRHSELSPEELAKVKEKQRAAAKAALKRRKAAKAGEKDVEMRENSLKARAIMEDGKLPVIAIDIESWEMDHAKLTEIGWAILEPQGPFRSGLLASAETRHIIIKEYMHLQNERFIQGHRDRFNFGKSQILELTQARDVLQKDLNSLVDRFETYVVIFHDAGSDLRYLDQLGITLSANDGRPLVIDTAEVYASQQGVTYERVGLGKLCTKLGLPAVNLHNAGNDAHATMHLCLVLLCPERVGKEALSEPQAPPPVFRLAYEKPENIGPDDDSDDSLP